MPSKPKSRIKKIDFPEWLKNALERIDSEYRVVLIETEEDINKYQESGMPKLRIGDAVNIRKLQPFIADLQLQLDNFNAGEWKRNNPDLYLKWKAKRNLK